MLRKLVLAVVVLVVAALAAEGLARVVYRVVEHRSLDLGTVEARKRQLVADAQALDVRRDRRVRGTHLAIHPYLGFVYDPAYDPEGMLRQHGLPVSDFGFVDDKWPVVAASPDQFVVGIFGGSMSWWMSRLGADALAAELARIPELRGRRIVLVRTSLGGAKQPQQLMALTYLLSLGGHFDAIVNLDGFNEVALTAESNVKQRVHASYPRDWAALVGSLDDPMITRLAGEITALTRLRGSWAELFLLPGLGSSAVTALVWRAGDGFLGRLTAARRLDLAEVQGQLEPEQRRFASHGPPQRFQSPDQLYAEVARGWKDGSLQMHRLARANGARYYHFLQPNQYLPESKPMLPEERAVAVRAGSEYGKSVVRGYPALRRAGDELAAEGVRFHDLTGAFAGIGKPMYIDDCCHVNEEGNALLGRRIGELIADDYAAARRERRDAVEPASGAAGGLSPAVPEVPAQEPSVRPQAAPESEGGSPS